MSKNRQTGAARVITLFAACAVALFACSCDALHLSTPKRSAAATSESRHYAPGRWRAAPFSKLQSTVLWVSHILILHEASATEDGLLRPGGWDPGRKSGRTTGEAHALARKIAEEARSNPNEFPALARRFSEDDVTSRHGGSLGGVSATMLPAPVLDALSTLRFGETSDVVQTSLGFHVLQKRFPPPRREMAGQRVVVAYRSTFGDRAPTRTREEALASARAIRARATSGADFSRLVTEFSDDPDKERGGHLGVWSTLEPAIDPLVVEALASVSLGEVTEPIDTSFGWQVVLRVPPTRNLQFAARVLHIGHGPNDRDKALQFAEEVRRELSRDADGFKKYFEQYCCRDVARWADGHGDPVLTTAIEQTPVGAVVSAPVHIASTYIVAQRVDPSLVSEATSHSFELPEPGLVDVDSLIGTNSGPQVAAVVAQFLSALKLSTFGPTGQSIIKAELTALVESLNAEDPSNSALTRYSDAMEKLHLKLPAADYANLMMAIQEQVSALLVNTLRP